MGRFSLDIFSVIDISAKTRAALAPRARAMKCRKSSRKNANAIDWRLHHSFFVD
jgi:hypothetical protein